VKQSHSFLILLFVFTSVSTLFSHGKKVHFAVAHHPERKNPELSPVKKCFTKEEIATVIKARKAKTKALEAAAVKRAAELAKEVIADSDSETPNAETEKETSRSVNLIKNNPITTVYSLSVATITTLCILSAKELKRKNATLKTVLKKLVTPSTFKETLREYPKTSLAVFVSTGLVGGGVVCGGIAGVKRLRK